MYCSTNEVVHEVKPITFAMEPVADPIDELRSEGSIGWAGSSNSNKGLPFKKGVDVSFWIFEHGIKEI